MTTVDRVEIHATDRCTLACHGCNHGVPSIGTAIYQASDYRPWLEKLATFATWHRTIVSGGEPFLHRDLAGFVRQLKGGLPRVEVLTNGWWLCRKDWQAIGEPVFREAASVMVSRYPEYLARVGTKEWDRRLDVLRKATGAAVWSFHDSGGVGTFTQHVFHATPFEAHGGCNLRECLQLKADGTLARCTMGQFVHAGPTMTAAFREAYGRSGVYDLRRDGEGFAEWVTPPAFEACRYCGLGTGHQWEAAWQPR